MPVLGVNVDHVATLRQARGGSFPDPVMAAKICEKVGAHSIVMHLREDRRHIQDDDLIRAKKCLSIRLNMEMSIAPSVVRVALKLRPDQATLVPEKRQEKTTEGGLNLLVKQKALGRCIADLQKKKIEVSLFIDPDERQIREVLKLGVTTVEFHTGDYANQATVFGVKRELARIERAVRLARSLGIRTHAGHGLDYHNTPAIARIPGIEELNIGYSIITQSLWLGVESAVKRMNSLVCGPHA